MLGSTHGAESAHIFKSHATLHVLLFLLLSNTNDLRENVDVVETSFASLAVVRLALISSA